MRWSPTLHTFLPFFLGNQYKSSSNSNDFFWLIAKLSQKTIKSHIYPYKVFVIKYFPPKLHSLQIYPVPLVDRLMLTFLLQSDSTFEYIYFLIMFTIIYPF